VTNIELINPTDSMMAFETHSRTDVGRVRTLNEDSLLSMPHSGLWLVADGMGGHSSGDYASQTIVAEISTVGLPTGALDLKSRFTARLERANTQIRTHAASMGGGTIGSTLVALLVQQNHFACIWSGDSRVYRMRGSQLTRVTHDHTEVQELLDSGAISLEEAENWLRKNVITRAIGVTDHPECDMVEGVLADADVFLLCSDGLTEYFYDTELATVLHAGLTGPLPQLCDHLVDAAVERGGKDNISVVLVRCHQTDLPELAIVGDYPEVREL
jgi:protein phosphatase